MLAWIEDREKITIGLSTNQRSTLAGIMSGDGIASRSIETPKYQLEQQLTLNSTLLSKNHELIKSTAEYEYEIRELKNQLREAQVSLSQERTKVASLQSGRELERQLSNDPEAHFTVSWNKRTEARIKQLCSLNRAGNSVCAWCVLARIPP